MQVYEELMTDFPELKFELDPLMPDKHKGLIIDKTIYLNPNQRYQEMNSTIAEEIGHYLTGSGNIILQDTNEKRKQERRARDLGAILLVSPSDIIDCFESGCHNVWECADHLQITEESFKDAVKYYARKFDGIKTENKYIIFFKANGTVSVLKQF